MRVELKKLHKKIKSTFIYVTHDQVEAMTLATRIAVMEGGRFSQISTPEELYERPANTFVARFIGSPSMNFVHGKLSLGSGIKIVTDDGIEFDVSSYAFAAKPASGQRVILGIRPELFHRPAANEAAYTTMLSLVEPLGANVLCYCQLGQSDIVASLNPSDLEGVRVDEELRLAVDLSKVSVFDQGTSLRL
jgi:multiple sugar transport system ATP-binding protein